jgi:hypothetical protein
MLIVGERINSTRKPIQEALLAIDSPNAAALKEGLRAHRDGAPPAGGRPA